MKWQPPQMRQQDFDFTQGKTSSCIKITLTRECSNNSCETTRPEKRETVPPQSCPRPEGCHGPLAWQRQPKGSPGLLLGRAFGVWAGDIYGGKSTLHSFGLGFAYRMEEKKAIKAQI